MIQFDQTYSINDGQESIVFTEGKGNTISGKYNAGNLTGSLVGNLLKATYHNHKNNGAGLIEIEFTEKGFIAKWKQGLEPGPMRGKWKGALNAEIKKEEKNIINTVSGALTDDQKIYLEGRVYSWDFEGDDEENKLKRSWLSDKLFLVEALKKDASILQYAPDNLKSDREIVLEAVKNDGRALEFASDNIKSNREIILEAVKNDGSALQDVAEEFKSDREVVFVALQNDPNSLQYVSDQMDDYTDAVLFAAEKKSSVISYIRKEEILYELAEKGSVVGKKINFKVRDLVSAVKKYFDKKILQTEDTEVISDIVKQWFEFNQIIYNNHPMDGDALLSLAQVQFYDYTPWPTDGRTNEEYTESLLTQAIELNDSSLWSIIEYGLCPEEYIDFTHLAEKACSLYWNRSVKDYVTALSILLSDMSGELRDGLGDEFVAMIIKEARENDKGDEEEKEAFESFVSDEGLE